MIRQVVYSCLFHNYSTRTKLYLVICWQSSQLKAACAFDIRCILKINLITFATNFTSPTRAACRVHPCYNSLKTIESLIAYKNKCKGVHAVVSISENRRYWYLWQMEEGFIAWSSMWDTCARRAWNLFLWKAAGIRFLRPTQPTRVAEWRDLTEKLFFFLCLFFLLLQQNSCVQLYARCISRRYSVC